MNVSFFLHASGKCFVRDMFLQTKKSLRTRAQIFETKGLNFATRGNSTEGLDMCASFLHAIGKMFRARHVFVHQKKFAKLVRESSEPKVQTSQTFANSPRGSTLSKKFCTREEKMFRAHHVFFEFKKKFANSRTEFQHQKSKLHKPLSTLRGA